MQSMTVNDYKILRDNQCSLQETSKDTATETGKICYMTLCRKTVVDFDRVKDVFLNCLGESNEKAKSVDALVMDNKIYLIEFKNGDARAEKHNIILKAKDSIAILNSIISQQIEFTRGNCIFILVYNKDKVKLSSKEMIAKKLAIKGKNDYTLFDLNKMQGFNFERVLTLDQEQFEDMIVDELGWGR